jgi:hypothetical protein
VTSLPDPAPEPAPRRQGRKLLTCPLSLRYGPAELLDVMRTMKQWRRQGGPDASITCTISDYDDDPRELHEIPEVQAFCRRPVDLGFIADLDVTTSIAGLARVGPQAGLGAFDVWALAEGMIGQTGMTEITEDTLLRFRDVLAACNRRADRALAEARGAVTPSLYYTRDDFTHG